MLFADDLEFVRNVYLRNGLNHPLDPVIDSDISLDCFIGLETEKELEVTVPLDKVKKLKSLARLGRDEVSIYTPGYTTKTGKQIKGYFRSVKVK